jgi:hypothetical protein
MKSGGVNSLTLRKKGESIHGTSFRVFVTTNCSRLGNGYHENKIIETYYFRRVLWLPFPPQNKESSFQPTVDSSHDDVGFMVSNPEN